MQVEVEVRGLAVQLSVSGGSVVMSSWMDPPTARRLAAVLVESAAMAERNAEQAVDGGI